MPELREGLALPVPKAGRDVIIDHARRLHVRVDNSAADEFEAAPFKVLA